MKAAQKQTEFQKYLLSEHLYLLLMMTDIFLLGFFQMGKEMPGTRRAGGLLFREILWNHLKTLGGMVE